MNEIYLEVTFRHGRPVAAYLHLPRSPDEKVSRTSRADPGLVIDYTREGKAIGIEITAPSELTLVKLNKVLNDIGQSPVQQSDLIPLRAA